MELRRWPVDWAQWRADIMWGCEYEETVYGKANTNALVTEVGNDIGPQMGPQRTKWALQTPPGELQMFMNVCYRASGIPSQAQAIKNALAQASGTLSVTVVITALQTRVNGFTVSNSADPCTVAERQMLAKIPGATQWHFTGGSVSLQPIASEVSSSGEYLRGLLRWSISPGILVQHEPAKGRLLLAKQVGQKLEGLVEASYGAYVT
jgi:hypothetical protein